MAAAFRTLRTCQQYLLTRRQSVLLRLFRDKFPSSTSGYITQTCSSAVGFSDLAILARIFALSFVYLACLQSPQLNANPYATHQ